MQIPSYCSLTFISLLLLSSVLLMAQGDAVVGVNLTDTGPYEQSESWQKAALNTLQNVGVRVIRSGLSNDEKGVDFAQRAFAHGIKLDWLVPVASPSGQMILSSADPEKSRTYFQSLLAKRESKGIVFAAFELGNEINWSNHDLGPIGSGKIYEMNALLHDPKGQQIGKGYVNYVRVLAALKNIRDNSRLNQNTPILTAGMGAPGAEYTIRAKRDAVDLAASIPFLRANGVDKVADAYGIHWYPDGNATPAAKLAYLSDSLSECSTQKPCWITEWGLPVSSGKSCPVINVKRTAIFAEIRNDFAKFAHEGRLKGVIFYTWEGSIQPNGEADNNPYGAFICGSMTKSGRLAVAPLR
jgi:hypothetical protein